MSVYVRGCIDNDLLPICKNTNGCWGTLFWSQKLLLQQDHIDVDLKGL